MLLRNEMNQIQHAYIKDTYKYVDSFASNHFRFSSMLSAGVDRICEKEIQFGHRICSR